MYPKGKQRLALFVVLGTLLIAGVCLYLFTTRKSQTSPPSAPPKVSEDDFKHIDDPDLRKHFVAQTNIAAYRVKSLSSGRGEYTVTEIQPKPEGLYLHAVEYEGNKIIRETVTIGENIYLKEPSGDFWWKQQFRFGSSDEESSPEAMLQPQIDKEKENNSYTKIGTEACGNVTCFKFKESYEDSPGAKRIFWFDTKDYLLRKDETSYGEFITTNEYTYDDINITDPAPVREVPQGRSIYEYMNLETP